MNFEFPDLSTLLSDFYNRYWCRASGLGRAGQQVEKYLCGVERDVETMVLVSSVSLPQHPAFPRSSDESYYSFCQACEGVWPLHSGSISSTDPY